MSSVEQAEAKSDQFCLKIILVKDQNNHFFSFKIRRIEERLTYEINQT